MQPSRASRLRALQVFLAGTAVLLIGVYLLKVATPYGLGLVNDSAAYVGGAEALLAGRGFTRTTAYGADVPILHFPPGYSALLVGMMSLGIDPLVSARLVGLGLLALGILLFGLLCRSLTGSWVAALFGGLLFAIGESTLRVYSFALSEPLFLVGLLGNMVALGRYYRGGNARWLAVAALAAAVTALARYTGLLLLVSTGLAFFLLVPPDRRRLRDGAAYLAVGAAPTALWLGRNLYLGGSLTNRTAAWHPISLAALDQGLRPLTGWLLPLRLLTEPAPPAWLGLVSWGILAALGWWAVSGVRRASGRGWRDRLGRTLGIFCLVYLAGLAVSISLFDASTPLDRRLLAPVLFSLLALTVAGLHHLVRGRAAARILGVVAAAALLGLAIRDTEATVRDLEVGGQGFAALGWQNSRAIEALRALPGDVFLYTNRQSAVLLLARRESFVAPTPTDPTTLRPRPDYAADLARMRERLTSGEAVLALFAVSDLDDPADRSWIRDLTGGVPILAEYNDATLYGRGPR